MVEYEKSTSKPSESQSRLSSPVKNMALEPFRSCTFCDLNGSAVTLRELKWIAAIIGLGGEYGAHRRFAPI